MKDKSMWSEAIDDLKELVSDMKAGKPLEEKYNIRTVQLEKSMEDGVEAVTEQDQLSNLSDHIEMNELAAKFMRDLQEFDYQTYLELFSSLSQKINDGTFLSLTDREIDDLYEMFDFFAYIDVCIFGLREPASREEYFQYDYLRNEGDAARVKNEVFTNNKGKSAVEYMRVLWDRSAYQVFMFLRSGEEIRTSSDWYAKAIVNLCLKVRMRQMQEKMWPRAEETDMNLVD